MSFNLDQSNPEIILTYDYGEPSPKFLSEVNQYNPVVNPRFIENIIIDGQILPTNDQLIIVEARNFKFVERVFPDTDEVCYLLFMPSDSITSTSGDQLRWIFYENFSGKEKNGSSRDNFIGILSNEETPVIAYKFLIQLLRNLYAEYAALSRLKQWASDKNNILYETANNTMKFEIEKLGNNLNRLLGFATQQKLPGFSALMDNGLYGDDLENSILNASDTYHYTEAELLNEILEYFGRANID